MAAKRKSKAAKKGLTKTKKTKVESPVRRPKTEIEHLETLLALTERNITTHGTGIDEFFQGQAERLRKQIQELRDAK